MELGPVFAGKAHEGQYVLLSGVHQVSQLRHLGAELVGHPAPLGVSGGSISFGISGADPSRDDAALGFACMGGSIAAEMHAAPLPGCPQHLAHSGLEPL